MLAVTAALAFAADGWVGGGVSAEAGYDDLSRSVGSVVETELDARLEAGPVYLRLDYDLKYDLVNGGLANLGTYAGPAPLPEWAMFQLSNGAGPTLRLGISSPAVGLEDWDDRLNYLPTTSGSFDVGPGRVLGGEFGWQLEEAPYLFAFGGYDLDYESPMAGVGVFFEGESMGVWSGFAAYPALQLYELIPSGEWYFGATTLSIDTAFGLREGHPFATTQTVVNLWSDGVISPVARLEVNGDPDGAFDDPSEGYALPLGSASLGVNFWPMRIRHAENVRLADLLKVQLEGRLYQPYARTRHTAYPGVYLSVSLWRPEPDAYTARYE